MSFQKAIVYNNPADFTLSSYMEIIAKAKIKKALPVGALSWATFANGKDLVGGGGSLTGTLHGTANVSGAHLRLLGGVSAYCDYDAVGNANAQQQLAIRFQYTSAYLSGAAPEQDITLVGKNGSLKNLIRLRHAGDYFRLYAYDEDSNTMIGADYQHFGQKALTQNIKYEMLLTIDLVNEIARLFIENKTTGFCEQIGSGIPISGIRSSDINLWRFGASYVGSEVSNCYIDDPVFYETIPYTSNYTAGYTLVDTLYTTLYQSAKFNSVVDTDGVISLSETGVVIPAGDSITYTITHNEVQRWYNPADSEWQVSTGEAQSNNLADFNSHIAELNLESGSEFTITLWMKSGDGSTTPEISENTLEYSFYSPPIACDVCVVYGHMYYNCTPDEGLLTIKTDPEIQTKNANFYSVDEDITARPSGYFEFSIPKGAIIEYFMTIEDELKKEAKVIIPDEASKPLDELEAA